MIHLIGYSAITIAMLGVGWLYGVDRYQSGYNQAIVERQELVEKQRDSYRIALEYRDSQYREVDNQLKNRKQLLEGMQSESYCAGVPIRYPD